MACDTNFILDEGFCTQPGACASDQVNCEVCDGTNCVECFDGFYLQNGNCVSLCEGATYEDLSTGQC